MKQRLSKLRLLLHENDLDGMVVSKPENRHYLSGFTGSAGALVISRSAATLVTDFRYIEQAAKQARGYDVVRHGNNFFKTLATVIGDLNITKVGFESDFVTYNTYQNMTNSLIDVVLKPVQIDSLRMIKDDREIELLKKAVEIADAAFSHILSYLRPGISELSVAAELEHCMRRLGAEKPAFDTIVASGVRGALPHGIASDKLIEAGDFVTMDFGAVYQGYHSDITRTVCVGKANSKQREIYDIVLNAQKTGLNAVQSGKIGSDVDASARAVIEATGYGDYFGHGLGHGVGLAIHEDPKLSPTNTTVALADNMTVTVEPGIYLPDWGGVRIEDTVVVAGSSCTILTSSNKSLIEI